MKTLIAAVATTTMILSSAGAVGTAQADPPQHARKFDRGHHGKAKAHYERRRHHVRDRYYRDDDNDFDNLGAIGAGVVVGAATAAIVGSAVSRSTSTVVTTGGSSHVERCAARYRSYDPATDTYVTYGGDVRRCRL